MGTPYRECPNCGAHLDAGELCDCRRSEREPRRPEQEPRKPILTLNLVCGALHHLFPFLLRLKWTAAAIISFTTATTIRKIPSFASMVDSSEEKVYSMGGR